MAPTRNRAGLTLLELMIVLIILVMLFAIAGPRLLGTQKRADIRLTTAQIGNFESTLKMYYTDMKSYPSTEEGLNALIQAPSDENKARKWDPEGYLDDDVVPIDAWDNAFVYEYPSTKQTRDFPAIYSKGPDGQENTDDDIINWRPGSGSGSADSNSSSSTGLPGIDAP